MRSAEITRETRETKIRLSLCLEGGAREIHTGIGFFDHMLHSFAVHGGFGLTMQCEGDLVVDGHHTVEDVGIVLGQALAHALGEKRGIARCRWTRRLGSVRWTARDARSWCLTRPCRSRCAGSMIPA